MKHIRKIDPYNMKETMEVVKEEMDRDEASLVLCTESPCIMLKREKRKFPHPFYTIEYRQVPRLQGMPRDRLPCHKLAGGCGYHGRRSQEERDRIYQ